MKIEKWRQITVSRLTAWSSGDLLYGGDVQSGKSDATAIIEPDDHAITAGIDASVIRAWDLVTMAATGDDGEGFEGDSL